MSSKRKQLVPSEFMEISNDHIGESEDTSKYGIVDESVKKELSDQAGTENKSHLDNDEDGFIQPFEHVAVQLDFKGGKPRPPFEKYRQQGHKKHLRSQGKEIIAKVYHRMKYEAENGVEKLTDAKWRTAQAVGVSEDTITQILNEQKLASTSADTSQNILNSPKKR